MNSISILTSRVTKDLIIPSTADTVVIRKLSPKQLHQAALARTKDGIGTMEEVYGPERVREIQDKVQARAIVDDTKKTAPVDPLTQFDHAVLMQKAIVRWSVDAPLEPATFEDVDADTSEWLAREILLLSKPSLFGPAADEAERKNG